MFIYMTKYFSPVKELPFCNEGRSRKDHLWIVGGKQAIMGREIVACDVECIRFVLYLYCTVTVFVWSLDLVLYFYMLL